MTATETVTASGQLSIGDIYRFSLYALWKRFWFFLAVMALCATYVPYSIFLAQQRWEWTFSSVLGLAFPFVLTPYAFFISPYRGAKKFMKTNPNAHGVQSYVFSDSGVEVTGPHSRGHLDWAAIASATETSAQFLLYPQQAIAHVIPKRFFTSPDGQQALRNLLITHVTKVRLRRN